MIPLSIFAIIFFLLSIPLFLIGKSEIGTFSWFLGAIYLGLSFKESRTGKPIIDFKKLGRNLTKFQKRGKKNKTLVMWYSLYQTIIFVTIVTILPATFFFLSLFTFRPHMIVFIGVIFNMVLMLTIPQIVFLWNDFFKENCKDWGVKL